MDFWTAAVRELGERERKRKRRRGWSIHIVSENITRRLRGIIGLGMEKRLAGLFLGVPNREKEGITVYIGKACVTLYFYDRVLNMLKLPFKLAQRLINMIGIYIYI